VQHRGRHRFGGGDDGARVCIEQVGLGRRRGPLEAIRVGFGVIQNELEIAIEAH
jgi:hypothetical protein